MTQWLKQSTAAVISFGPFVDPGDGVALEVGLVSAIDHGTTGIMLSKNGGALTIRHASVTASTYDAYGNYLVTLDTTDTNTLGRLRVQFAAVASCVPIWQDFMVMPANVYDSLVSGSASDYLQVDMAQILGTAVSAPATAGILDINLKNIANAAVSTSTAQLGVNAVQAGATAWGSGAITAASIASGAITNAKFAAGAIDAAAIADNAIDAGAIAADAITAAKIAAGAIDNATFAADVGSTAYATNIIALAADKAIVNAALATATNLATLAGYVDTEVAAILADTNELQTDWVQGGRLDLILDIIAADTTTDIPAELAKVPKSDSNVSWNATALAAINAEVDTALNTAIPGSPTADSINERVATIDTSVALMRLLIAAGTVVDDNDPDPTATAFETNLAEASNDHYNGAFLVFTSGALLEQSRKIAGYVGATKVITTSAFTEAPAGGDTFAILGRSE